MFFSKQLLNLLSNRLTNAGNVIYADMLYGFIFFISLDQILPQQIASRIAFIHTVGVFAGIIILLGINLSGHRFVAKNFDKLHSLKRFIFFEVYLRLFIWLFLVIFSTVFLFVGFFTVYEFIYILAMSLFPLLGMQWYFLGVGKSLHYLVGYFLRILALFNIVFLDIVDTSLLLLILSLTLVLNVIYVNFAVREISFFTLFLKRRSVAINYSLSGLYSSFKRRFYVALSHLADAAGSNIPFLLIGVSSFKDLLLPILLLFRFSKGAIAIASPTIMMIIGKYSKTGKGKLENHDLKLLISSGIFAVILFYSLIWIYYQGSTPLNDEYMPSEVILGLYTFFIIIGGGLVSVWIVTKQKFKTLAKGQSIFVFTIILLSPFYMIINPTLVFIILLIGEIAAFIFYCFKRENIKFIKNQT